MNNKKQGSRVGLVKCTQNRIVRYHKKIQPFEIKGCNSKHACSCSSQDIPLTENSLLQH